MTFLFVFSLTTISCQKNELPKEYAIDGTEYNGIDSLLTYEDYLLEMKENMINESVANRIITRAGGDSIEDAYSRYKLEINMCRKTEMELFVQKKKSERGTFKAYNSAVFCDKELRDEFNTILKRIDSLDVLIGFKKHHTIK